MEEKNNLLDSIKMEVVSEPVAKVIDNWPCVQFNINLVRNEREINTKYKMGIGYFKWSKRPELLPKKFAAIWNAQRNPGFTQLADKQLAADYACFISKTGKIRPQLKDVLHYLACDAMLGDNSFEDYCAELGCSEDSIKARDSWESCRKYMFEMRAMFLEEEIELLINGE